MSKPLVYLTRLIPDAGLDLLVRAGCQLRINQKARGLSEEELCAAASDADAMICQLADGISASVLKQLAPKCKIVATCAVGYDNIDVAAAKQHNIVISNTPDVLTNATADLTWALLLATARRLGEGERLVRAGAWRGWEMMQLMGADVFGRSLGLIGAGRIGQAVAKRATGFDMKIRYVARSEKPEMTALGAERVDLNTLLTDSDFVSLHTALTPETHHLINAKAFDALKPGAILINTARGSVVDQVEMIQALRDGRLAAAGLDVFDGEPAIPNELLEMDNVVLLPHIGSATVTTRTRMAEIAAENVIGVLAGKPATTPVNAS